MTQNSPLVMFTSSDGKTHLQIRVQDDSLWLTQTQIAELFTKSRNTISEHISHIYDEGELKPEATIRKFRTVALEGTRNVERLRDHYNLDMVIAIGYRVRSSRGAQFRTWATQILKEYLIKGFAMDDERLRDPNKDTFSDYFDELLERIRDIRASERRFYQKITDIYSTATDYSKSSPETHNFFATVQNKLHWAIHGHTAAELVKSRANSELPNMGLRSWSGGEVTKKDVSVAKNYLSQEELSELNQIVTMYLDFAELQAKKKVPMTMAQWAAKLDAFLEFNDQNVLSNAGQVSQKIAQHLAEKEYDKFVERRRANLQYDTSDFDEMLNKNKLLKK